MLTKEEWKRYKKVCYVAVIFGGFAVLFGGAFIIGAMAPGNLTLSASGYLLAVLGGVLLGIPLIHERHEDHYRLSTSRKW